MNTASEMSNLVGMYAISLSEDGYVKHKLYIMGKANNNYFICQFLSAIDGEPNVAKLMTVEDLLEYYILPTIEIANMCLADYYKHDKWRWT